jgi:cytochrome d ubiquinol oxidase subunit I
MNTAALLLSRIQFAFTISFHIIFPAFTIGLAAWLTVLEALFLITGRPAYRAIFEFWLKIFGVTFGLGVVSGIVMAFQFGTNWSVLSRMSGPIQGPLLSYETFTAFMLEATFFGVLIYGRTRVPPWFYLFSTAMVATGTTFSAFWIMVNNSWMQVPVGYVLENEAFVPDNWTKIIFNPVVWVRFPHMLLAAYLTGSFCVAATGAWYLLRKRYQVEANIMLRMGLFLAAVLVPAQIFFGHLTGDYVHNYQPAKFAAIEGRWHDEQPAGEVLIAIPDSTAEANRYEVKIPVLGSLIGSMSLTSKEVGLTNFLPRDRPPVLIPFFAFRIMVGCGLVMLGLAWLGSYLSLKHRLESNRLLLWLIFLSFPLPFIATLTADERASGKAIGYLSIPLSTVGGSYFGVNQTVAQQAKERIEKRFGAGSVWILNPGAEGNLPGGASGADYMYMWTQILEGRNGLGEDFDFFYFTGPSDFAPVFSLTGEGDIEKINAYFDRRLASDADFKKAVDQGKLTKSSFRNYYALHASVAFSLGSHDEWNISHLINDRRRGANDFGIANQIPILFDGHAVPPGSFEGAIASGDVGRCIN